MVAHFTSAQRERRSEMKLPTPRLTVVLLLLPWSPPGLASPQPLEKFPHPYVAHPAPHQEEVQVHLPDHHPEELKLPRKCRTDYVSVVSKVGQHDDDDDDDDDDDGRSATRCMRRSAARPPSTSTRLSTWRSARISNTSNVVPQPGNILTKSWIFFPTLNEFSLL